MAKARSKRCKICKGSYIPTFSTLQMTCTEPSCILAWADKAKQKKDKREIKAMRERNKSVSQWRKELQQIFNTFIRLRDKGKPCISCGKPLQGKYDAGHYYSVGSYPNLRFHEWNVHGQCVACNQHHHGNLLEYNEGILNRIGKAKLDELKSIRHGRLSLPLDEIKASIEHYKQRINELKDGKSK